MIWFYLILAIILVLLLTASYKSMIVVVLVPIVWLAIWLGSKSSKVIPREPEPKPKVTQQDSEPIIISWLKKLDEELEKASKKK